MDDINKRSLLLLVVLFLWAGNVSGASIQDLVDYKQDPRVYVDAASGHLPLLPSHEQKRLNAEYDLLYFAPWHITVPRHTPEQVSWGFREYGNKPGYKRDGTPYPPEWMGKMAVNARLEDYPQGGFPAVAVKRIDFRVLPTRDSHSIHPQPRDKSYPFDNLQESSAPPGTPVLVTLVSRDGRWLLTETSWSLGWVPSTDLAVVDEAFIRQWENGRYVAVVRDKAMVRDEKGGRSFAVPLGAVFSKIGEDSRRVWIWTAGRDRQGRAFLRRGSLPKTAAADKPLPFTAQNMARLAAELVGEPYGWGGLHGKRDCSAMIRDLATPFGIWLPRNSREQAEAGRFVDLRKLSPGDRESLIMQQGVPWRTLLWMPGHIMLYIGIRQDKPLIFHNFWSARTRDASGNNGKTIVGKAAVTTLQPGRELSGRNASGTDIAVMTFLGEKPSNGIAETGGAP